MLRLLATILATARITVRYRDPARREIELRARGLAAVAVLALLAMVLARMLAAL